MDCRLRGQADLSIESWHNKKDSAPSWMKMHLTHILVHDVTEGMCL